MMSSDIKRETKKKSFLKAASANQENHILFLN